MAKSRIHIIVNKDKPKVHVLIRGKKTPKSQPIKKRGSKYVRAVSKKA